MFTSATSPPQHYPAAMCSRSPALLPRSHRERPRRYSRPVPVDEQAYRMGKLNKKIY